MPTSATHAGLRASRPIRVRLVLLAVLALVAISLTDARRDPVTHSAEQTAPARSAGAPPSLYDQALTLYRADKPAEAAVLLEKALAGRPQDAAGYHALLGWCRYRMGQDEAALKSFAASLELAPASSDGLEGSARSLLRLGRRAEALAAARALAAVHPEVPIDDVIRAAQEPQAPATDRLLRPDRPAATPRIVARARGDYLEIRTGGGTWQPIFVKGINLGAALPGKYPSEFPGEAALYATWLRQMSEMGANAVRLYTLLPPAFYRALRDHNASRKPESYLWLVQGVWTELPENDAYDAPAFTQQFTQEMDRVTDAIHGAIEVAPRPGHASGIYDADVSTMTLAWILGREWEPYSVEAFDNGRPHPDAHDGKFVRLKSGTPTEAWIASMMDHIAAQETRRHGMQHPVAFTNWPTLDPLRHPTESTKREEADLLARLGLQPEIGAVLEYDSDGVGIDATRIEATAGFAAGTFASYHAYPYYPDFMNVDPGYLAARDTRGPSAYAGYLRELKAHHAGMPLLIAEVGVPTSRGIAHHQPQGWHHGGHNEREQGEIDARLMEAAAQTGCAGGILFAWLDEWFKRNWLVLPFEVPEDSNRNWLNILDPEQNYGLLACKPGRGGWRIRIDGRGSDWDGIAPLARAEAGPLRALRVTSDEAYLYVRLDVDRIDFDATRYVIGLDTYGASEGDHRMPLGLNLTTPTGMEFVVDLSGLRTSSLLCDPPYDLYTNRYDRPWRSVRNDDGQFIRMRMETNRRRVGRDGTLFPPIIHDRSPLRYGTMDPQAADCDDLAEINLDAEGRFIELRLGWNLLNVTDPSTLQVLHETGAQRGLAGHTTTDGIRFYAAAWQAADRRVTGTLPALDSSGSFPAGPLYSWQPWEQPTYHTYLKKSYFILKDRLAPLRPRVAHKEKR